MGRASSEAVLSSIQDSGFTPLGWFEPRPEDTLNEEAKFVILIGNAGPAMFARFARERDPARDLLDDWTREVVTALAHKLGARALFPFDKPPLPFLTWARRGGGGHVSPLGLNIHPTYGLWHAYRAALVFSVTFGLPSQHSAHPCESCADKPCLTACPVGAFTGRSYDVEACVDHVASPEGEPCMSLGCLARRACPVGRDHTYSPAQATFHMLAFRKAQLALRRPV